MIDLTPIFNVVIMAIAVSITMYLIPFLKTKYTASQLAEAKKWVYIAVQAAEQIYVGGGRGEEKKQAVVDFLAGKGFKIDFETLDKMIESAVFELQQ